MINKRILLFFMLSFMFLLNGCEDQKGKGFIGHWYEVTDAKYPVNINIQLEDGVFHIDENRVYPGSPVKGEYSRDKLEAKADSDNVLSGIGFTMRIENGELKYKDGTYKKMR
ncbi:hypothetical protein [Serratia marcescens]|uniref:hypothetical protein n=1 Tax=Serratia marcescens TaxID=615 RepID=UPI0024A78321|nr:hypothetical protein [Serratia marcescens]